MVCFAGICIKYLRKGRKLQLISSRITFRNWKDKNGTKFTTTIIIANKIRLSGNKKNNRCKSEKGKDQLVLWHFTLNPELKQYKNANLLSDSRLQPELF